MASFSHTHAREVLRSASQQWGEYDLGPVEAYAAFRRAMGQRAFYGYTTYLSTSITSGGYKRDVELPFADVITKNADAALHYADYLGARGLIRQEQSIDAVSLSPINGWQQLEYMQFWFMVMARPEIAASDNSFAAKLAQHEGYDIDVLNNGKLYSNDIRRPHHVALVEHMANCLQDVEHYPIDRVVQLVDRKMSLGGDAEALFAHKLGTAVCCLCAGACVNCVRQLVTAARGKPSTAPAS